MTIQPGAPPPNSERCFMSTLTYVDFLIRRVCVSWLRPAFQARLRCAAGPANRVQRLHHLAHRVQSSHLCKGPFFWRPLLH
jgi:hypothetical protein